MSHPISRWLFSARPASICSSCRTRLVGQRPFSSTPTRSNKSLFDQQLASIANAASSPSSQSAASSPASRSARSPASDSFLSLPGSLSANTSSTSSTADLSEQYTSKESLEDLHHLHVYATKHNTHITLTNPKKDALISVSCGNIGARKAQRGSYDAAYQLAAWVMKQIPQKGQDRKWINELKKIELVLRGFGHGREAVTKVLMGSEGRQIRPKIVRVTDATRLKFGGVRSPKPRRLG